jgi:hypothetical protein
MVQYLLRLWVLSPLTSKSKTCCPNSFLPDFTLCEIDQPTTFDEKVALKTEMCQSKSHSYQLSTSEWCTALTEKIMGFTEQSPLPPWYLVVMVAENPAWVTGCGGWGDGLPFRLIPSPTRIIMKVKTIPWYAQLSQNVGIAKICQLTTSDVSWRINNYDMIQHKRW